MQDKDYALGVNATGDIVLTRKPDVAYISLYVRADGVLLEDAMREALAKVAQVHHALSGTFGEEIRDIQVRDLHLGDGKLALGMIREKSAPPRPEVVKGVLVVIPPKPELAIKIVDSACRMGCLMTNPGGTPMQGHSNVILYGLADPDAAEEEATALAIADAKGKASRIARSLQKKIGEIRHVGVIAFHSPEEFTRRNRTPLLSRGTYLSVMPEQVEIPGKVSVGFQLID